MFSFSSSGPLTWPEAFLFAVSVLAVMGFFGFMAWLLLR